jgi:beta-galactosidase
MNDSQYLPEPKQTHDLGYRGKLQGCPQVHYHHRALLICLLWLVACGSTGSHGGGEASSGAASGAGASSSGSAGMAGTAENAVGGMSAVGGANATGGATSGGAAPTGGAGGNAGTSGAGSGGLGNPPPVTDRARVRLATGWKFIASDTLTGAEAPGFDDAAWSSVLVPHTWDSVQKVTKHSNSWYRSHFSVSAQDAQKRHYIYFEGAFQVADVYVNGQHLGQHRGGYTRFIFDASSAVIAGKDNVLAVQVSNADCADCLPAGSPGLFKGYGGIYRKAWLITTNQFHVATTDHASSGVYVTPNQVSAASAQLSEKIFLTNDSSTDQTFHIEAVVSDAQGNPALTTQGDVLVTSKATTSTTQAGAIAKPALWSPSAPNLYGVRVTVSVAGKTVDVVDERFGFRSYQLSPTDFTLNGASTRLRGVCKHQETEYNASAVSDTELTTDWDNLQDLGVNFVRLVHYPHAQLEYDLADQRGIMVWAENGHTDAAAGTPNGDNITKDMVYQNWNHPSILFWSAGNEASGVAATTQYAAVAHAADPSRSTVYASDGQAPSGIDFTFHNTYAGWYGGTMYDFLTVGDHYISETGAGMEIATHTGDAFGMIKTPNSYEPEEYGALVNEVRFDDLIRKPSHIPAFSGWSFREISDGKYKGLINTKGLLTFAGYKKNAYYHLQSLLRKTPVVHLVGSEYFLRAADASKHAGVKAYSNAAALTLKVNGALVSKLSNDQYTHPNGTPIHDVFYWSDALLPGKNLVTVDDGAGHSDEMTIYYLGTGASMPVDASATVSNLKSSNGSAYFIAAPIREQVPFYFDFDSTGDNTFDTLPGVLLGASWIATKRQSDAAKRTDLAFDLATAADVFILATKQPAVPAWIASAGFTDTGTTGQWRDNDLKLVPTALYKQSFAAGAHVTLTTSAIDYVVLVK